MKINKLRVRGEKIPAPDQPSQLKHYEEVEVIRITGITRGGDEFLEIDLKDSDVVEFQFDDGTVWLSGPETIEEVFPEIGIKKRGDSTGSFEVPLELSTDVAERGIFKKVGLKLLKVFTKKSAVKPAVKALAAKLEDKQLGDLRGLLQLMPDFTLQKVSLKAQAEKPYLLFIHGTANSTAGTFEKLKASEFWKKVFDPNRFENVLAFQHQTLTKSPLENVLDLVSQLPKKATLHLVTQSRGGIVGDVLSRCCIPGGGLQSFSQTERDYLEKNNRKSDLDIIDKIDAIVKTKQIKIEKYIRTACPASGTTLASKRLDHLLNIIFNLLGLAIGQAANPVYIAFKDLLTSVVETKDDPDVLPGMEIQNPVSPFIKMLNNGAPAALLDAPMMVIAGNSKVNLKFKALLVIASKLFFFGKNDMIVNTQSMFNGAKRADNKVQFYLDESPTVSHFNYFENPSTRSALLRALDNDGSTLISEYQWLTERRLEEQLRIFGLEYGKFFLEEPSGKRPIVLLLPGIMGSNLSVDDSSVWINYLGFVAGKLSSLRFDEENNKHVRADSIIKTSYKKLAEFLDNFYDVITFPFDWRMQLNDCAKLLNDKLLQLMKNYRQPIKLVGHSMGGVLVRDFILQYPDTWKKLNSQPDFKLLFLGSPLGGSFRIPRVLFGEDAIINTLGQIDMFHSRKKLVEIFCQFPGILSLLPLTKDDENDFAKEATWKRMADATGDNNWPIPSKDILEQFGKYRDAILKNQQNIDYSNIAYIAGRSRPKNDTPLGYKIVNGQLKFLATKEGDESVTWDSGIPRELVDLDKVYYSDVTHGALANAKSLFGAISEILISGKTNQLSRKRPVVRGNEKEYYAKTEFAFDLTEAGVASTILGIDSEMEIERIETPISVLMINCNLKYASYPVLAGHFMHDGILYAEKDMNSFLDGELQRMHQLGQYPGEIGSSEVVLNNNDDAFRGSVIVGLGIQGQLTEYRLARSVEQGVTRYLSLQNGKNAIEISKNEKAKKLGISSLVIGCGYGGLSVESSIRAIIQGTQNANEKIRQTYENARLLEILEFVELYEDRALTASYAIGSIEKDNKQSLNIIWENPRIKQKFGWRKRIPLEVSQSWWVRLNVSQQKADPDCPGKKRGMQFLLSTNAAREELRVVGGDSETIQQLLEEMSVKNSWNPELAKAIFELLIPNDFKEQIKRQNNLNWIVDKETAAYPWELLQDSTGKSKPLSVNAGMIRQLATGDYRIRINPVVEKRALVVADPNLEKYFTQLEGAAREGEVVGSMLRDHGFDTSILIKRSAAEIILGLFSSSYKIIHLAGHGVFNADVNKPSGMLIGNKAFLTTQHVEQMSTVPELVFVNCCYLGQVNAEAEEYYRSRYKLAANIGTQLIEIGVKAVVVAGWAVDDEAALAFTEKFYEAMFEGNSFGDATLKARQHVYQNFSYRSNTWGAFQCYGDPFYSFAAPDAKNEYRYEFVLAQQAEIELENLLNELNTGEYVADIISDKIAAIAKAVDDASLRTCRINELEAYLFAGLGYYQSSIDRFNKLWSEENAVYSFRATEQYCNIMAKYCVERFNKQDAKLVAENKKDMEQAISIMESLIGFSPTIERLNILASTFKRYGLISSGQKKQTNYEHAATKYLEAYLQSNNDRYYPLTNFLSIENALVFGGEKKWGELAGKHALVKSAAAGISLLEKELKQLETVEASHQNFWELAAAANIALCTLQLNKGKGDIDEIFKLYDKAWKRAGHRGNKQAELEQIDFILDALGMVKDNKADALIQKIKTLKAKLEAII